ncbi:MAG: PKD domain-containing protein [Bacteroidota bacterium]
MIHSGCKVAPLPIDQEGEAVFLAIGELDSSPLTLEAGKDDYYQFTSFRFEEQGLYTYRGTLAPSNCEECPEGLSLSIRDHRLRAEGEKPDMDSVLREGFLGFFRQNGAPGEKVVRVYFENSTLGGDYQWDFGDGNVHLGANPVHEYTDSTLISPKVCLEAADSTGCVTSICNELLLSDTTCSLDFEHERFPGTSYVSFRAKVQGQRPFQFRWDFGDGFGASLGNPGYFYTNPGLYTVCLTVTDATGCQRTLCKNIAADPAYCENNFSYRVERTQARDNLQFSTVTWTWRDESGTLFSSALGPQDPDSFFELDEQSPYLPNENGAATRILRLRSQGLLYSEDGRRVRLNLDKGAFGIAHP